MSGATDEQPSSDDDTSKKKRSSATGAPRTLIVPAGGPKARGGLPAVKGPPPAEAKAFLALIQSTPIDWVATEALLESCREVVNARETVFGWRPLHFAVNSGKTKLLTLLLEKRVDLKGTCNLQNTGLHIAARGNHEDAARLLTAKSADVNAKNSGGYTPLMCAAMAGSIGVVDALIGASAQLDVQDPVGRTAPMWAARHGHKQVLRTLLQCGVDLGIRDDGGLGVRDHAKHSQNVRSLIAKSEKLTQTLLRAAEVNDVPAASRALSAGAPVDALDDAGNTSLTFAAINDSEDMLRLLLRHGADPSRSPNQTASSFRPGSRVGDIIQTIMRANTGLVEAARQGNETGVEDALQAGAWPNMQDRQFRRPAVSWAVVAGSQQSVTLIAEAKADLRLTDSFGKGPVHYALLAGAVHVLSALYFLGADFSHRSVDGDLPLHLAAMANDAVTIQLLHAANASCEDTNSEGKTPIQLCAGQGCTAALVALLRAGADATVRTEDGRTILALAASNGHAKVIKTLLSPIPRPTAPAKRVDPRPALEEDVVRLEDEDEDEDDMASLASLMPPQSPPMTATLSMNSNAPSEAGRLSPNKQRLSASSAAGQKAKMSGSKANSPSSSRGFEGKGSTPSSSKGFDAKRRKPGRRLDKGRGAGSRGRRQPQPSSPATGPAYLVEKARLFNQAMDEQAPAPMAAIKAFAELDEAGQAPLALATRCRRDNIVSLLLKMDAPVNLQDSDGISALMLAASLGEMGIVQDLLAARGDPLARDFKERSPLEWAATPQICKVLQHYGDKRAVDKFLPKSTMSPSATGESFKPESSSIPPSADQSKRRGAAKGADRASFRSSPSKEALGKPRRQGSKESLKATATRVPSLGVPTKRLSSMETHLESPPQPLVFFRYRMEGLPKAILPDIMERQIRGWLQSIEYPAPTDIQVAVEPTTMRPQGYAYLEFLMPPKVTSLLSVPAAQRSVCGRPVSIYKEVTDAFKGSLGEANAE